MTTFEERIARVNSNREQAARAAAEAPEPGPISQPENSASLRDVILVPIGIVLGALAVLIGGVIKVAIVDGGLTPDTLLPPDLGVIAFAVAFGLSLLADRVIGLGGAGRIAVTVGFIGMIYGERYLFDAFPALWIEIYQAEYLSFITNAQTGSDVALAPHAAASETGAQVLSASRDEK